MMPQARKQIVTIQDVNIMWNMSVQKQPPEVF